MIQEKSGFWDSIDATPGNSGDERTYDAAEMTIPFEYLVTNGVQIGEGFLQVTPGSYDYSSQIAPGMAWIRGRWYLLRDDGTGGATHRILLHDAPIQYNRIDRIVLRYDANYTLSGRKIVAVVLKGEEAADPVAPELTRTDEIYELSLAQVLIKPGQPVILEADITDERFDGGLCGIAEFAPQPDLQPYIEQFQQQLNAMFMNIEALDAAVITSGKLHIDRMPEEIKVKKVVGTLLASGWEGAEAPFTQTIEMLGVDEDTKGYVGLPDTATTVQRAAARDAQIAPIGKGTDQMTFAADGSKPETDLSVVLIIER